MLYHLLEVHGLVLQNNPLVVHCCIPQGILHLHFLFLSLYQMDFETLLKTKIKEKLDMVFIDPPYETNFAYEAVKLLLSNGLIKQESVIIIETDQEKRIKEQLKQLEIEIMDERKYGRAHLIFLGQKRKG